MNSMPSVTIECRDAGLRDLCVESGMIFEGSVTDIIEARKYNRTYCQYSQHYVTGDIEASPGGVSALNPFQPRSRGSPPGRSPQEHLHCLRRRVVDLIHSAHG